MTLLAGISISCTRYSDYKDIPFEEPDPKPWQTQYISQFNREEPRAYFIPYTSVEQAQEDNKWQSPLLLSLNGTWKFNLAEKPADRPFWFFKDNFDTRKWDDIQVPANWEVNGYDYPIYVNVTYPHDVTPPAIQEHYNPVGSYKRQFTLPDSWNGKEIYLHAGAVSSNMNLWINGEYVGYSEDSKTPAEFNITRFLKKGKNSYFRRPGFLEDQRHYPRHLPAGKKSSTHQGFQCNIPSGRKLP